MYAIRSYYAAGIAGTFSGGIESRMRNRLTVLRAQDPQGGGSPRLHPGQGRLGGDETAHPPLEMRQRLAQPGRDEGGT